MSTKLSCGECDFVEWKNTEFFSIVHLCVMYCLWATKKLLSMNDIQIQLHGLPIADMRIANSKDSMIQKYWIFYLNWMKSNKQNGNIFIDSHSIQWHSITNFYVNIRTVIVSKENFIWCQQKIYGNWIENASYYSIDSLGYVYLQFSYEERKRHFTKVKSIWQPWRYLLELELIAELYSIDEFGGKFNFQFDFSLEIYVNMTYDSIFIIKN